MFRSTALFAFCTLAAACAAPTERGNDPGASESNFGSGPAIPKLPAPGGSGALTPWGGNDSARWRPEAILANAASEAMNAGWARSDVRDVPAELRLVKGTMMMRSNLTLLILSSCLAAGCCGGFTDDQW